MRALKTGVSERDRNLATPGLTLFATMKYSAQSKSRGN